MISIIKEIIDKEIQQGAMQYVRESIYFELFESIQSCDFSKIIDSIERF